MHYSLALKHENICAWHLVCKTLAGGTHPSLWSADLCHVLCYYRGVLAGMLAVEAECRLGEEGRLGGHV